eukprot:gb/GECG01005264.1/.p1 GENE.gb/GECG01005264.1/~~gb/GECG01005264.1/.p1  ORF type:complete len:1179 (+),score=162.70 gb/GECG01005264.1/:1-3537(+)
MSSSGWRTTRRGKASAASTKKPASENTSSSALAGSKPQEKGGESNKADAMLKSILDKCQKSKQSFNPSALTVKKFVQEDPQKMEEVATSFTKYLEVCMPVYKKCDPVDRVISFVGELCRTLGAPFGDELGIELVSHFIKFWNAKDKGVRFRVCQLLCTILGNLSEEVEISDKLWSELVERMKQRTFDKIGPIRAQAVRAVERLQDITDPSCPIVKRLCHVMENDSNKEVRAEAVNTVALTEVTLNFVMRRTKDVEEPVRMAAIRNIDERVACTSLSIEQRISLLRTAFSDRSTKVRQATGHMLVSWLARCKFDLCQLLGLLDVVSNFELAKNTIFELIDMAGRGATEQNVGGTNSKNSTGLAQNRTTESQLSVKERFDGLLHSLNSPVWENGDSEVEESELVDFSKSLTPERTALWICLVERASSTSSRVPILEKMVPTLSQICFMIFSLCDEPQNLGDEGDEEELADIAAQRQFMIECLLNVSESCDFHDEMGRQRFILLVKELMGHKGPRSEDEPSSMLSFMLLGSEDAGPDGISAPWLWQASSDRRRMAHLGQIGVGIAVEGAPLLYGFMKALLRVIGRREEFVRLVVDVLEDLLDSGDNDDEEELATIRNRTASASEYYTQWVRALHITAAVLKLSECNLQTPELADLIPTVILPGITSEFCAVRTLAVYSLGLAVMVGGTTPSDSAQPGHTSVDLARRHFPLLVTALEKDELSVRMVALQVLTDWMLLFNPFELCNETSNCFPIELLLSYLGPQGKQKLLTIDEPRMQSIAAESVSKLTFTGRLNDNLGIKRRALSALLRSYFTPSPEFDEESEQKKQEQFEEEDLGDEELTQIVKTKQAAEMRMRQSLGTFFVTFSKMSSQNQTDLAIASCAAIRLLATDIAVSTTTPSSVDTEERLTSFQYALQFIAFLNQPTDAQGDCRDTRVVEYFELPCSVSYHQLLALTIGGTILENIPVQVATMLVQGIDKLLLAENGGSDSFKLFCGVMKYVCSELTGGVSKLLAKSLKPITSESVEAISEDEQPILRSLLSKVDDIAFPPTNTAPVSASSNQSAIEGAAPAEEAHNDSDSPDEEGTSFSPQAQVRQKPNKKKKRMSMGMAFVQSQVESFQHQHQSEEESDSDDSFVSANEENTGEGNAARRPKERGSTESHVGPSGRNSMSLNAEEIENALAEL